MPETVALTVYDRLGLLELFQDVQGNITTLRLVRDFKHALEFDEADHAHYRFQQLPTGELAIGNADATRTKEIRISDPVLVAIRQRLKEWDKKELLRERHLPLVERFLTEKPVRLEA